MASKTAREAAEKAWTDLISHAEAMRSMLDKMERDMQELLRAIKAKKEVHERGIAASEALLSELWAVRKAFLAWQDSTKTQ